MCSIMSTPSSHGIFRSIVTSNGLTVDNETKISIVTSKENTAGDGRFALSVISICVLQPCILLALQSKTERITGRSRREAEC